MKTINFLGSTFLIEEIEIKDSIQFNTLQKKVEEKVEITIHVQGKEKEVLILTLDFPEAYKMASQIQETLFVILQSKK